MSRLQKEIVVALTWAAVGLLVVSIIALFIMRDITVALGRVVGIANGLARGEHGEASNPTSRKDEIGALADSFDRMIVGLKEMTAVADRIAGGDLNVVVKPRSERDILGRSLARMVEQLSSLVGEVHRSGIQVNTRSTKSRHGEGASGDRQRDRGDHHRTAPLEGDFGHLQSYQNHDGGRGRRRRMRHAGGAGQSASRMEQTMRHVMEAAGSITPNWRCSTKSRQHQSGGHDYYEGGGSDQPALAQRGIRSWAGE